MNSLCACTNSDWTVSSLVKPITSTPFIIFLIRLAQKVDLLKLLLNIYFEVSSFIFQCLIHLPKPVNFKLVVLHISIIA